MHSEGILAGEMKHGPLALVDEHMPMIVLATQDRACNKMHSVVQQLRARGAAPLVVCNVGDDQIAGVCEGGESRLIRVSPTPCRACCRSNVVASSLLSMLFALDLHICHALMRLLSEAVTAAHCCHLRPWHLAVQCNLISFSSFSCFSLVFAYVTLAM